MTDEKVVIDETVVAAVTDETVVAAVTDKKVVTDETLIVIDKTVALVHIFLQFYQQKIRSIGIIRSYFGGF